PLDCLRLALAPPRLVGADAESKTVGDSVQPATQRLAAVQRGGLAHQDKECRLKGVFRGMGIVQHTMTDAEHHGPIAPYEHLQGGFIALDQKSLQELTIRHLRGWTIAEQVTDVAKEGVGMSLGHIPLSG